MNKLLGKLSPSERRVLARVRLAVTARLCILVGNDDAELRAVAGDRPFSLRLSLLGLPSARIYYDGSRFSSTPAPGGARGGLPSLTLFLGGPARAIAILSGSGALPLPLPGGPGAMAALRFFRAAASLATRLVGDAATPPALRARLLAEAALEGLATVASFDSWISERLAHAPTGLLAVECPGSFAVGIHKGESETRVVDPVGRQANARLAFRDSATAIEVLSGKRQAVLALASGDVAIAGLIPLVQGIFAVLDRLGDFMAVSTKAGGR